MKTNTSSTNIPTEGTSSVTERIFNLFTLVHDGVVFAIGAQVHDVAGSEEEKMAFLQRMVPRDALTCERFSFPHSPGMVPLPGTDLTGVPEDIFVRQFTLTGRALDLFEPALTLHNASEAPLFCLTTVRNGRPVNDDGPIYEGGSEEADRAWRHQWLADRVARTASRKLRDLYRKEGKFAVCMVAEPTVEDPLNHKMLKAPENRMRSSVPEEAKALELLSTCDPENEVVVFFSQGGDAHLIKLRPEI